MVFGSARLFTGLLHHVLRGIRWCGIGVGIGGLFRRSGFARRCRSHKFAVAFLDVGALAGVDRAFADLQLAGRGVSQVDRAIGVLSQNGERP